MSEFPCSSCGKWMSVGEASAGAIFACPHCGSHEAAPGDVPLAEEVGTAIHGDQVSLGDLADALRDDAALPPRRGPAVGSRGPAAMRRPMAGGTLTGPRRPGTGRAAMYGQGGNAPGAMASLVCGILSLVGCFSIITGPIALFMGFSAIGQVRRNPGYYSGEGLAVVGMVCGGLATLATLGFIAALALGLIHLQFRAAY